MKRKYVKFISALSVLSLLTGCGTLTDTTNYNFYKDNVAVVDVETGKEVEKDVFTNRNKSVEIYYDISNGMKDIVADAKMQGIIQDAADAVIKTWNDVEVSLYTVGDTGIEPQENVSYINNVSAVEYSDKKTDALMQAVDYEPKSSGKKVIVPRIKLIVTDFSTQLGDYQKLADDLSDKLLGNGLSVAMLSVKAEKPLFIFAIGALKDLSDYLTEFYQMPNIADFNGIMDFTSMDMERNVNCKLFLQNSGIMGVDYDNIVNVEQGRVGTPEGMPPMEELRAGGGQPPQGGQPGQPGQPPQGGQPGQPGQPPQGGQPGQPGQPPQGGGQMPPPPPQGGQPGQPPQGQMPGMSVDGVGSFSKLRTDYHPEDLKKIVEGFVNFQPEEDGIIRVDIPENISSDDISEEDIKYISFRSLLWAKSEHADTDEPISGKIKITVPFEVVPQVQLTDLNFEVETVYSDANKGDSEFYELTKDARGNVEVGYAYNDGPTNATWRIDNVDRTAMINVYVNDLLELPYATKLDIKFGVSDPGKMPVWVQNWTNRPEYKNLKSFVSLLNDYAVENSRYSESLTVYVLAGDKSVADVEEETIAKASKSKKSEKE